MENIQFSHHCSLQPLVYPLMPQVGRPHVLALSPLLSVPHVNLITQAVMEPMHLFEGGAVKMFTDILLYSTAARHDSRLAKAFSHRLSAADISNLDEVLMFYKRIMLCSFPRKLRRVRERARVNGALFSLSFRVLQSEYA